MTGAEVKVLFEAALLEVRYVPMGGRFTIGGRGDLAWPGPTRELLRVTDAGVEVSGSCDADAVFARATETEVRLGAVTLLVSPCALPRRHALAPRLQLGEHIATFGVALFAAILACMISAMPKISEGALWTDTGWEDFVLIPHVHSVIAGMVDPLPSVDPTQRLTFEQPRRRKRANVPPPSRRRGRHSPHADGVHDALALLGSVSTIQSASIFGDEATKALAELKDDEPRGACGCGDSASFSESWGSTTIRTGDIAPPIAFPGKGSGGWGGHDPSAIGIAPGAGRSRGSIDKRIIQRVVRAHINEVRFCYERELQKDAALEGRVELVFAFDETGVVSSASVEHSTLNAAVDECLVHAVQRWSFGNMTTKQSVTVKYPFVLRAHDAD